MKYPKLQPTAKNTFILLEDYTYSLYTVPKGYETDGATIHRIFWSFVPPFKPELLPAVVVHDYLCDIGKYHEADMVFADMLRQIDDNWKTKTMAWAVRFYTRWIRCGAQ